MTRYAIYFTPSPDSSWAQAGNQWLGRDATSNQSCVQPEFDGVSAEQFSTLTSDARRYGFHATLKAPFKLADGFTEAHLLKMAKAFCATQKPVALPPLTIADHRNFLALQIVDDEQDEDISAEINALADNCLRYFDVLRAPSSDAEQIRRRHADSGLSPQQEGLLQKWGYPYTEELFRFHMTLTGSIKQLDASTAAAVHAAAVQHFSHVLNDESLTVGGLTILREEQPGAPFVEWKRFNFTSKKEHASLPTPGRLFFCVGPCGVDKDALLQWTQDHLSNQHRFVFAQCVSMRPNPGIKLRGSHLKESGMTCDTVDFASFWQIAAAGQFAMVWQANDLYYGIRRGIEADLKAGCDVVVNGSRAYVPQLRSTFPNSIVVWIDPQESPARNPSPRIEKGPAVLKQLSRTSSIFTPPDDPHVVQLNGDGSLESVGHRLLGVLSGASQMIQQTRHLN